MFRLVRRVTKYVGTALNLRFSEMADPKVQLTQTIEEAQKQHRKLKTNAAQVIANQKQTEMRLSRKMAELEQVTRSARQAVVMADEAEQRGDSGDMIEYTRLAEGLAGRMTSIEGDIESLKHLHGQATHAANRARAAVEHNSLSLQKKLTERQRLLSQLDQAKMQEQINKVMGQLSESVENDAPALEQVRNKIEDRYAKALGAAELNDQNIEFKMLELEKAAMDAEAQVRLTQLRAQLGVPAPRAPEALSGGSEVEVDVRDRPAAIEAARESGRESTYEVDEGVKAPKNTSS